MPSPAKPIILAAQDELQDPAGVRWPATELVQHLHEGQRAIAQKRPDTTATVVTFSPAAPGARHTLPAAAASLIDIPRNAAGRKRAITKVDQVLLDATVRDWQGMTPSAEVLHFMHDLREPRVFLTYPPASTAAALELVYSAYPAATATAGGAAASTVTGNIGLPDEWATALRYYVLFRAWSKDAEYGGNPQLAATNYGLFKAELGEQLESAATVAPAA
ncbi:MAG: hypothetical protein KA195_09020 [Burkholderiaceae bacterium]|nr:hypothetical protein [Burkholderiaceae bacterium]